MRMTRRCRAPECFSACGAFEGLYPAAEGDPAYPVNSLLSLRPLRLIKLRFLQLPPMDVVYCGVASILRLHDMDRASDLSVP
jgi:hypothetical protein